MGDNVCVCDVCTFNEEVYESSLNDRGNNGILRTIKGPVAEWDKLNRNKRKYSEKLWDKVLASPYVQEQLRYHTLYGEAGHPTDRYEVDFSRVSHSITALWKVPASNQIYATINILDTPLGRIINTLYEAGGVIGYSSRAGGTLNQRKGYVDVDENTYNFITFDAVPFPSVESARPSVNEGVGVDREVLPDEVHDKLCGIISESSSESREAIKGLIYSLETYDLSREKTLLEEKSHNIVVKDEPKEETTMSLLKESSLQIDYLKATNQTLRAAKSSLEKENKSLRENLNSSLANITKLMNESKRFEDQLSVSESKFDDTIQGLEDRIHELMEEIEDKDLEIGHLEDVYEAFKALQLENRGLKSEIALNKKEISEQTVKEREKLEVELKEAYSEVSKLVSESSELSSEILRLKSDIEDYEDKIRDIENSKQELLKESRSLNESLDSMSSLEKENERLKREIEDLNESVDIADKRSERYRDDLISVICSGYNLTVESVKKKLPVGFTKSDIYCVCEEMNNSLKNGIDYSSVVSESVHEDRSKNSSINKHRVSRDLGFINRRGVGML